MLRLLPLLAIAAAQTNSYSYTSNYGSQINGPPQPAPVARPVALRPEQYASRPAVPVRAAVAPVRASAPVRAQANFGLDNSEAGAQGYVHDPTGDDGLPYVHDATGDFGPYQLYKLRQQQKAQQQVPTAQAAPTVVRKVVRVRPAAQQNYRPAPQQNYRPAPQQTYRPAPQQTYNQPAVALNSQRIAAVTGHPDPNFSQRAYQYTAPTYAAQAKGSSFSYTALF